jgi:hypothetical protein
LDAFERSARELWSIARSAAATTADRTEGAERTLAAIFRALAADPAAARLLFFETPRSGPDGRRAYQAHLELAAFELEPWRAEADLPGSVPLFAVGGVEHIVVEAVREGRAAELENIVPDALFTLLTPFVGPDSAAAARAAAIERSEA